MRRIISRLIRLVFKKLCKKKQPIIKAVNSTIIKNMPFVMPCIPILQEFSQRVFPIIKQTETLQSQIRLLTEARDRLLPKLMSGEIEV